MRLIIRPWRGFVAVLSLLATGPATPAQTPPLTSNSVMPVTMEVVASCQVSASDLDFGAYRPDSPEAGRGQTVIQLTCAADLTVELLLDAGMGAAGNTRRRQMTQDSGPDRMDYDLFQDPGRRTHWGDKSGRDALELVTTGAPQVVTVYGEIPAKQRVRQGTYSDVITVQAVF